MKKTIAAVLTAFAMIVALVLPMSAFALDADLADDVYAVDYTLTGDGTMKMVEPAKLVVKDGKVKMISVSNSVTTVDKVIEHIRNDECSVFHGSTFDKDTQKMLYLYDVQAM